MFNSTIAFGKSALVKLYDYLTKDARTEPELPVPNIHLKLPDGTVLIATATDDDYPSIDIERINKDGHSELLCFAEFNPDRGKNGQLCIGAYQSAQDEPTYYKPYETGERSEA